MRSYFSLSSTCEEVFCFFGLATNTLNVRNNNYSYCCLCVCIVIPFILDVRLVNVTTGVAQEEGHTGFLRLPSAVLALIFLAKGIQTFLSLVYREVDFLCTNELIVLHNSSCPLPPKPGFGV